MGKHMENFNTFSVEKKIWALQLEISQEEGYQENTSNPMKFRRRKKYIKDLKQQLRDLESEVSNG